MLEALKIVDAGYVRPEAMTGSWAGAMGQNQFMPSSFMQYAVDYDGDGRRDIWTTVADVFASTANYLASSGWRGREPGAIASCCQPILMWLPTLDSPVELS